MTLSYTNNLIQTTEASIKKSWLWLFSSYLFCLLIFSIGLFFVTNHTTNDLFFPIFIAVSSFITLSIGLVIILFLALYPMMKLQELLFTKTPNILLFLFFPVRCIANSLSRLISGKEALSKVLWLWGALIYLSAFPTGFYAVMMLLFKKSTYFLSEELQFFILILHSLVIISGTIFIFIYPFIMSVAFWKTAQNLEARSGKLLKAFIPLFWLIHIPFGAFCSIGLAILFQHAF